MFRNLRQGLGTKFTVLLSVVFVVGILSGGLVHWNVISNRARSEITSRGQLLIEAMSAVRSYTSEHIQPLLSDRLATSDTFIPETVPAYSASTVFETVRRQMGYSDLFYKEATLNPTNPRDQADAFEADLISRYQSNPSLTELSEIRTLDGRSVYYTSRPLIVSQQSCLVCHSTPETAPASQLRSYGKNSGGYGWKLNEIIGARIIYVPAGNVLDAANQAYLSIMAIFIVVFAAALLVLNFLLRRYVLQPLKLMSRLAQRISGDEDITAEAKSAPVQRVNSRLDELGALGKLFVQMGEEVHARTEGLKQKVAELNIVIDDIKREKQVNQVVDSEFFQDLQARASALRKQRKTPDSSASQ